jgi:hypothetical protein
MIFANAVLQQTNVDQGRQIRVILVNGGSPDASTRTAMQEGARETTAAERDRIIEVVLAQIAASESTPAPAPAPGPAPAPAPAPGPAPAPAPTGPTNIQLANFSNASTSDVFIAKYTNDGNVQWIARISSTANDVGYSIVSDTSGNIYVGGYFTTATLTIYNADGLIFKRLSSSGNEDCFLVKYSMDGTAQWATQIQGTGAERANSLSADANGNIYITGYFSSPVLSIVNEDGTLFGTLNRIGTSNIFLVKYNSSGVAEWARIIGGTGTDIGNSLTNDVNGNIFLTGYYNSSPLTIYNGDGTTFGTLSNEGSDDCFLIKYNESGNIQWTTRISATTSEQGFAVTCDTNGNSFLLVRSAGIPLTIYNYDGTAFGTKNTLGSSDVFLIKYNTNGFAQWVAQIGGTASDGGFACTCDFNGDVCIVGDFASTTLSVYNQDDSLFGTISRGSGVRSVFLIKYNTSGSVVWTTRMAGASQDLANGISNDGTNNIFITGTFTSNPVSLYNSDGTTYGTLAILGASTNTYLIKYTSDGFVEWATQLRGIGVETGQDVVNDATGNVYMIGQYISNNITFFNQDGTSFSSVLNNGSLVVGTDIFVVKYTSDGYIEWATRLTTSASDQGISVVNDRDGNVYATGRYGNTLNIYNSDGTLYGTMSNGNADTYIVKYSTSGMVVWVARIGGTGNDSSRSIACDSSGNIYITGTYTFTSPTNITIYNADQTSFGTLTNSGSTDTFIVKYSTDGVVQWATKIGGTLADEANSITCDSTGNIYIAGQYTSATLTFLNTGGSIFGTLTNDTSTSFQESFIVKYNTNGIVQWIAKISGASNDIALAISSDSDGNTYMTGHYSSNPLTLYNQDGTTFGTLENVGGTDGFVAKYNTNGEIQWISRISGTLDDRGLSICLDASGNVYMTGYYDSTPVSIYDQTGISSITLETSGFSDVLLVKYSSNGAILWATRMGGAFPDQGTAIVSDGSGNIYITGHYGVSSNPFTIYNQDGTSFSSAPSSLGSNDIFIVKYTPNGVAQWVSRIGGGGDDRVNSISADATGNIYLTGHYASTNLIVFRKGL